MPPPLRSPTSFPSATCIRHLLNPSSSSRSFSTTSRKNEARLTRARRQMFLWLATQGAAFRDPLPGSTNYLSAYNSEGQLWRVFDDSKRNGEGKAKARKQAEKDSDGADIAPDEPSAGKEANIPPETRSDMMPFPTNRSFISQPVLSEELREEIWKRIMEEGKSVRVVSAELGVEMSRVGAVVRLMEIQKEWQRIGKPLARPYAQAVLAMLPKTPFSEDARKTHESINDLPVHAYTGQQIFHPTSESRHFTRADAAKVFHKSLLPADDRVPHPELVEYHRDLQAALPKEERMAKAQAREDMENRRVQRAAEREAKKEAAIKKVDTGRWEFRFTKINVDDAGKTGRGAKGVGWRYGMPHMDRSRGAVKIPTSAG